MEHYSVIKRNKVLIHALMWIKLENIKSQTHRHILYDLTCMRFPEQTNLERN
jgi:hypothetical protein